MNIPLRNLNISTRVSLHPELACNPLDFAAKRHANIVSKINPSASFKNDRKTGEKTFRGTVNIHLVENDAIRLFTECTDKGYLLQSIRLDPALLLYGDRDHPLVEADLEASLCRLQAEVTPLLERPEDACHIIPGLVGDDGIACWSGITTEMRIPGIDIRGLHDLSHPLIGTAEGTTKKRVKMEDASGACSLVLEKSDAKTDGTKTNAATAGIRVTLKLKGHMLHHFVEGHGTLRKIQNADRLVHINASAFQYGQNRIMSRLEGYYLPIPAEWTRMGKTTANFKVIALTSQLTSKPGPDIVSIYADLAKPTQPTVKKLNASVQAAQEALKPVPVSSLFTSTSLSEFL